MSSRHHPSSGSGRGRRGRGTNPQASRHRQVGPCASRPSRPTNEAGQRCGGRGTSPGARARCRAGSGRSTRDHPTSAPDLPGWDGGTNPARAPPWGGSGRGSASRRSSARDRGGHWGRGTSQRPSARHPHRQQRWLRRPQHQPRWGARRRWVAPRSPAGGRVGSGRQTTVAPRRGAGLTPRRSRWQQTRAPARPRSVCHGGRPDPRPPRHRRHAPCRRASRGCGRA